MKPVDTRIEFKDGFYVVYAIYPDGTEKVAGSYYNESLAKICAYYCTFGEEKLTEVYDV